MASAREPSLGVPRTATAMALEAMTAFRVVVLNGPRQAGKTTILRQLRAARGGTLLGLDDEALLGAAREDPAGLVLGPTEPIYIDEIQRGGDPLVRAVKVQVDTDPRPGRYVLAGSTSFLTVPTLAESLAGRARLLDVWPFSQGERDGVTEHFIDAIFAEPRLLRELPPSELSRNDYYTRMCAGGFPEAFAMSPRLRGGWFASYVTTLTQRDIRELARIRQASELPRLLRLIAGMTAQELVKARLAEQSRMDAQTVANYLPLLATVFLIHEVPAWSRNLTAKVKRHPKVHLVDTGLAAHLLGLSPTALALPVAPMRGPLLETFVVNELAKQRQWSEVDVRLYHWRDRAGPEVDVVLEAADGRVVGIESKAALDVSAKDFRWLRLLESKLGGAFVHGVVLYTGTRALSFGDRLTALPVSALWHGG